MLAKEVCQAQTNFSLWHAHKFIQQLFSHYIVRDKEKKKGQLKDFLPPESYNGWMTLY